MSGGLSLPKSLQVVEHPDVERLSLLGLRMGSDERTFHVNIRPRSGAAGTRAGRRPALPGRVGLPWNLQQGKGHACSSSSLCPSRRHNARQGGRSAHAPSTPDKPGAKGEPSAATEQGLHLPAVWDEWMELRMAAGPGPGHRPNPTRQGALAEGRRVCRCHTQGRKRSQNTSGRKLPRRPCRLLRAHTADLLTHTKPGKEWNGKAD